MKYKTRVREGKKDVVQIWEIHTQHYDMNISTKAWIVSNQNHTERYIVHK